jgi:acyl-CoA synthetase (AMP-forming)/AMP-acid ligase II
VLSVTYLGVDTADWSDWYTKDDPTTWVLAEVLRRRATDHPDRDYLKFADRPWLTYGQVNSQANRVANALLARGVAKGESVSVMLPNCEEFVPAWYGILKAGAVMSSINTAYKGDFLSWTINLVEAKKLIISDQYLDRLDLIKHELPKLEHVIVLETGAKEGPDPTSPEGRPHPECAHRPPAARSVNVSFPGTVALLCRQAPGDGRDSVRRRMGRPVHDVRIPPGRQQLAASGGRHARTTATTPSAHAVRSRGRRPGNHSRPRTRQGRAASPGPGPPRTAVSAAIQPGLRSR